jgi:hypothetical protein
MIAVRFTKGFGIYNAGEIAGFETAEAEALVKAGVAEAVTAGVEVPAVAAADTPAPSPRTRRRG